MNSSGNFKKLNIKTREIVNNAPADNIEDIPLNQDLLQKGNRTVPARAPMAGSFPSSGTGSAEDLISVQDSPIRTQECMQQQSSFDSPREIIDSSPSFIEPHDMVEEEKIPNRSGDSDEEIVFTGFSTIRIASVPE